MANFSCTIAGTVTGLVGGSYTIPSFSYVNASSPGLADLVSLTTTLVALTVPTNALFLMIVPPSTNTINLELAGADVAGVTLHPTNPSIIPIPASSTSVFLGCASSTVANVQIYWL